MKKIIFIIAGLVVLALLFQKFINSELKKTLKHYDKVLVEYQKEGNYTSAYYELNHTFNRIAAVGTSPFDHPRYTTKQIIWTEKELNKRVESLLPKLDEVLPEGIEDDWSSTEELRNRYNSFYQKRIAILNRDKAARKQTELIIKLRGIVAPEQLPEGPSNIASRKSGDISSNETAAKRIQPKEARLRQKKAQDRALEMMKKATETE